jgi:hypothetical protein
VPILRLGVVTIAIIWEKESVLPVVVGVVTITTVSSLGEGVWVEAILANRFKEVGEIS